MTYKILQLCELQNLQPQQYKMIDNDESEWSLSSVQVPIQKNFDEDESSFAHTTLHQEYSYQSKHPPQNKPIIVPDIPLHSVGKVMSVVEDFVVIDSEGRKVIDLETYLINKDRQIVGYIVDVFGPVQHHFYALKQEDNHVQVGQQLFYIEGCRVLQKQDIDKLMQIGIVKDDDSQQQDQAPKTGMFKKRDRQVDMEKQSQIGKKIKMQNYKNNNNNNKPNFPQQQINPQNVQFQSQMMFGQQAQYNPNMFYSRNNSTQYPSNSLFGNQTNTSPYNNNYYPNYNNPQLFQNNQFNNPMPNTNNIQSGYQTNQVIPPQNMNNVNPQQMRRLSQYYQNCYQQIMFNQNK